MKQAGNEQARKRHRGNEEESSVPVSDIERAIRRQKKMKMKRDWVLTKEHPPLGMSAGPRAPKSQPEIGMLSKFIELACREEPRDEVSDVKSLVLS